MQKLHNENINYQYTCTFLGRLIKFDLRFLTIKKFKEIKQKFKKCLLLINI